MVDHRRKTYYGRRRRRRSSGGICAAAAVLLLAAVFFICLFLPETDENTGSPAAALAYRVKCAVESVTGRIRGGQHPEESDTGSAGNQNSGGAGEETVLSARFSATEASENETGIQSITVVRRAEPEPETEPPVKYEENENTKLLEGDGDITLTFAGDILFDSRYAVMASLLERSGGTPEIEKAFSQGVLEQMRASDVFMVNNEFPYSDRGTPLENKQFTFRADPAYASLLTDMGVDIVSLANNHMYDHGETALLDTLDTLTALNLPHIGAGRNLKEASAPYYFTNGQVKIGIITATQIERLGNPDTKGATDSSAGVFRCMNSANLLKAIGEMKDECDFIVAYLHWGTESTDVIDEWQKKLAKEVAGAGADLIIGDHPHVLQGIGMVDGVPVVYSLGNFLFNSGAQDTCLVTATVDPETAALKKLVFIPARQESCRTKLLEGSERSRVLDYMRSVSDAEIDDEGCVLITGKK